MLVLLYLVLLELKNFKSAKVDHFYSLMNIENRLMEERVRG